jgi:hypothetical protein
MAEEAVVECSFFIPVRRDAILSDGQFHTAETVSWLDNELYLQFEGRTIAPGFYEGCYKDPDTGEQVTDQSRKYTVAMPRSQVDALRSLLSVACVLFQQKSIYLNVAGKVEFIKRLAL